MLDFGFDVNKIDDADASLWRYAALLPKEASRDPIRLGAGWTGLFPLDQSNVSPLVKLEYLSPTASFKDRGTEVEFTFLKNFGVKKAVEDSSGNAGASAAAYAARSSIGLEIFAPDNTSVPKLDQIKAFGASIRLIAGIRQKATDACLNAVEQGVCYASHAWSPAYLLGQTTFAWEVWEQLGKDIPEEMFFPVGQGGLLMGAWLGFTALLESHLISRLPRLTIVQPKNFFPLVQAVNENWNEWQILPALPSAADGLSVSSPVRWKRIQQAVTQSGGQAIAVTEDEIITAQTQLARHGFYVEPSSAVAFAGYVQVYADSKGERVVIPLTGSGLKSKK